MKSMWIKIVLMTAIGLHLTACGKQKSDEASVAAAAASPQKTEDRKPADGAVKAGNKEDKSSQQDKKDKKEKKDKNQEDRTVQSVEDKGEEKVAGQAQTKKDDKANVNEAKVVKQSQDKYSGSADDYLRSYLIAQEAELGKTQRDLNKNAAESILATSLKVDYNNTGDVALSLKFKVGNEIKSVLMGGIMKEDRTSSLRSSREKMSAQLKCMDMADPVYKSCETALVSMKLNGGNVNIIFRRTNMNVKADFGNKQCLTQECEDIFSVFKETEEGIVDLKTLDKVKLESTEIINGRSSFRGIMRTRGGNGIVIGGDLLNENLYPTMNLQADRTMNMEDLVDLQNLTNLKTGIHRSLSDVRIVGNDGYGMIRMRVTMKVLADGSADSFDLSFQRISQPISPMAIQLN